MANVLTDLAADIYKAADMVGRELTGFIPSATINAGSERAALNDPVRSHFTRAVSVGTITASMTVPEGTDQTVDSKTMTLDTTASVKIPWTGEDMRHVQNGSGFETIYGDQVRQAIRAIVNQMEADIWAAAYVGASRGYGAAATTPFASSLAATANVRKILDDNGAPLSGRACVIDTAAGAALRTLAAPCFSDTIFQVNSKDAYQQIQGIWLYEISELESFGRVEATAVKAFISSVEDNYRAPYERANERHKRQTVFAGTTNAKEWLKDWTGNTRFWPIEVEACGPIDLAGLAKVRDQLFAEAVALYRKGERRYPTRELEDEHFRPHQDLRMIVHPWVEKIADWLIMGQRDEVTINDILVECLRVDMARMNPTGSEAQTVGKVMASLGWDKVRRGKERQYVWRKPKVAKLTATREQQSGMEAGDVPF